MYNALLSQIRGEGKIALACASSGIASLFLRNGRTAHSRFKKSVNLEVWTTFMIHYHKDQNICYNLDQSYIFYDCYELYYILAIYLGSF